MLLEQVELLKEEQQFSMQVHQQAAAEEGGSGAQSSHRAILKEKDDLFQENQRLLRELDILREAVVAQESVPAGNGGDGKHHEKAISKLLAEIKELRHENQLLRKKATINENGLVKTPSYLIIQDNKNASKFRQDHKRLIN